MFAACTRRFRTLSSQQRARLQDVQALKTVLGNVDAVALLLRSRPTTDLLRLLSGSDTRVTGDNLPPAQHRDRWDTTLPGVLALRSSTRDRPALVFCRAGSGVPQMSPRELLLLQGILQHQLPRGASLSKHDEVAKHPPSFTAPAPPPSW